MYRGTHSITAKVQVGSGARAVQRECAFPLDTPLEEIRRWQDETRQGLRKTVVAITRTPLEADIDRYLGMLKCTARDASIRRSHLKPWLAELGQKRRHQIRGRSIESIIAEWIEDGVAPKTILNRFWALHHLLVTLAGSKRAWTPLANVDLSVIRSAKRGKDG